MDRKIEFLSQEQLYMLNELLLQLSSLDARKAYLQSLGRIYELIQDSPNYLLDERDYSIYSVVQIGKQHWLGENLRYPAPSSVLNGDNPNLLYGRLYNWATVMNLEQGYNKKNWDGDLLNCQGIAPYACCIPSDEDWKELEESLGLNKQEQNALFVRGEDLGDKLKFSYAWESCKDLVQTDFNALPSGYYLSGNFDCLHSYTGFWSSTEYSSEGAWYRSLDASYTGYYRNMYFKEIYFSCRCICI